MRSSQQRDSSPTPTPSQQQRSAAIFWPFSAPVESTTAAESSPDKYESPLLHAKHMSTSQGVSRNDDSFSPSSSSNASLSAKMLSHTSYASPDVHGNFNPSSKSTAKNTFALPKVHPNKYAAPKVHVDTYSAPKTTMTGSRVRLGSGPLQVIFVFVQLFLHVTILVQNLQTSVICTHQCECLFFTEINHGTKPCLPQGWAYAGISYACAVHFEQILCSSAHHFSADQLPETRSSTTPTMMQSRVLHTRGLLQACLAGAVRPGTSSCLS